MILFNLVLVFLPLGFLFSQKVKPNDRWFIKPHIIAGYTIGKEQSGFGYGVGIRGLYDFETRFLGAPLFLGLETSFLSPLGFYDSKTGTENFRKQNYLILTPALEQNYKWLNNGFTIATCVGYYIGIQENTRSIVGLITNIGWFPIYNGKEITPYVTYRNDWAFDKNGTNMQSISLGLNF